MPTSTLHSWFVLACLPMVAGVFVLDLLTPRGMANGVLYVVPVLVTLWSRNRWSTHLVAGISILLTLIGFFVSPDGTAAAISIGNRAIAVLTIAAVASLSIARRSTREALEGANRELSEQAEALSGVNAHLERTNAELEQEVAARARAELNLLRSNRELEEFAYVAAHDLTSPLRHIVTFLDLLEHDFGPTFDERAADYVASAARSAKHMQALITDLLMLAQVDAEKQLSTLVDCNAVFDHVLLLLRVNIEETQAMVTRDTLPTLMAVERQLVLVLQNLIANALKYRGESPPRVHVSAAKRDDHWVLCVRDNGIGIDAKHNTEVFKIFRRLHTSDEYPGTGIGLALCQRIIERHGGRIWLESSQPSVGSTFCFLLPDGADTTHVAA